MGNRINALILGDVIGQPGCRAIFMRLKDLKKKYNADVVVVNGENAASGYGITPEIMNQFFENGVDVITSGNHIWQRREILPYLDTNDFLLRPGNYPPGVPGKGYCILQKKGVKIAVLNLQGRVRMHDLDCPFRVGEKIIKKVRTETRIIFVDFHAEAVDEKEALALYLDGKISALVGTHTHVQTADQRILSAGTAYITDIGMTGSQASVIGFDKELAVKRSLTQMPLKVGVAEDSATLQGVCITVDAESGKALNIERVFDRSAL